jgi:predicted LPLAT superfamily acyltransferase
MTTPEWANRPERGSEWLLKLMYRIAMLIGRPAAGVFLYPIAAYFWITTGAARRDSKSYLTRVLGRPPNWRESYRHYLTFSVTILDRFYFLSGRADEFEIDFHGEEAVLEALAQGRGAFLVGAHLGSFEALRMLVRQRPHLRVGMAMFEENAQKIRRLLTAIDPTLLDDVVPLGHMDSMIRIQERLERGDMVGFLADRSFGHDANLTLDFLGEPAQFPTGVFRMACLLKQPVIFMTGLYRGGNRYDVRFDRVIDFTNIERAGRSLMVEQGVKEFAARIEAHCRLAPYNWFNFYDFWAPPVKESKG